jgi:hypothetical protein
LTCTGIGRPERKSSLQNFDGTRHVFFLYKCTYIGVRGVESYILISLPSCFTKIHVFVYLFKDDCHHGLQVAPRFPVGLFIPYRKGESEEAARQLHSEQKKLVLEEERVRGVDQQLAALRDRRAALHQENTALSSQLFDMEAQVQTKLQVGRTIRMRKVYERFAHIFVI